MEKQAKKRSVYVSPKLYAEFQEIQRCLSRAGEAETSLTDALSVVVRDALKRKDKLVFHRAWTFDQVVYRLKRSNPALYKATLTKDSLKELVTLLEEKARETEAALEGDDGSIREPSTPRRRATRRSGAVVDQTSEALESNPLPVANPVAAAVLDSSSKS